MEKRTMKTKVYPKYKQVKSLAEQRTVPSSESLAWKYPEMNTDRKETHLRKSASSAEEGIFPQISQRDADGEADYED